MRTQSLKTLVKSYGTRNAGLAILEAINDPDPRQRIDRNDVSIREIWEAFVGPCGLTTQFASRSGETLHEPDVALEAPMDSRTFANITQALLGREVIDAFTLPGLIGDQLVMNYPSRTLNEKLPGFTASEGSQRVLEGQDYPESKGITGMYVGTDVATKNGIIIAVTEEAIFFDQTGMLMDRARGIGEKTALDKELTILRGVTGTVSPFYPSGTIDSNFYQAGPYAADPENPLVPTAKGNLIASNPLVDWTSIEASRVAFNTRRDSEGDPILVQARQLLVPDALRATALRAVGTTQVVDDPNTSTGAAARKLMSTSNSPLAELLGGTPTILSSPILDFLSITTSWFHGDFKRQFRWKDIWPLQTFAVQSPDDPDRFKRDIVAKIKVRFYGGIFAKSWEYVNRNNA